jgi:hypothetical protein
MVTIKRWIAIFVATLTVLVMLPILLISAQPYEAGHLGLFLVPPEECRVPCFMGVRPRQTNVAQAVAMLRANEAIELVQVENYYAGQSIFWRWKEGDAGYRRYGFRVDQHNLIDRPVLPSDTILGDVLLALGKPSRVTSALTNEYQSRAAVVLEYPDYGLYLFIGLYPCKVAQDDFWRLPYETGIYGTFFLGLGDPSYARVMPDTRIELDTEAWAKQLRDFCRAN